MIEELDVREMLLRRAQAVPATPADTPTAVRRARRRLLRNGAVATVAAVAIAVATFAGVDAVRTAPVPADRRSEDLGIFAPVAGRIVYEGTNGNDRGYDRGLWAVDPSGPSDTTQGPSVADDVATTLVPLGVEDARLLGWSSDGTELLFMRKVGDPLLPDAYLSILHADGSETRLNKDAMGISSATIAPDGTRVVFAGQYDLSGLYAIDAEGGQPVQLPIPQAGAGASAPTFSPDGTQIAYLAGGGKGVEEEVWVANADGTDAHEILADEPTAIGGESLEWSPAGDRLAIGFGDYEGSDGLAIYTFAPDGSDFTKVITGGTSPYWSPDGSQIAYTILCEEQPTASCPEGSNLRSQYEAQPARFGGGTAGLAIADADGSNVRAFGFAASGPWHPAGSAQANEATPIPSESFARADGEVLDFTGSDLVAVNPATGQERVLVEDPGIVHSARWSADGRWVAYETDGEVAEWDLWVVGGSLEPRLVATGGQPDLMADYGLDWMWSPTGAQLAVTTDSTLVRTIDLTTGETTDLRIVADGGADPNVNPLWAWSPDGTRIAFQMPGWALSTVDVRSGEGSLLVRMPSEDVEWIDAILWSPDGASIAVRTESDSGAGRLFAVDAEGSDVRVLDDSDPLVADWSPDGTRLAFAGRSRPDGEIRIWVAPMDGAAPVEIGSVSFAGCAYNWRCDLTWSPDGSQIAFHEDEGGRVTVFDADGAGETEPIDELTYASWDGGSYRQGPWSGEG